MRLRYRGFVLGDEPYLLATWHPETRPGRLRQDEQQRWLGLSIRATLAGGIDDFSGEVEFVARFKVDGKGHRLHEYLDGEHL